VPIRLKRAYEPPAETDGLRILVDRFWTKPLHLPGGGKKNVLLLDRYQSITQPEAKSTK
jgi:uncharacterized protein YeaO (DUF488 family)